MTSVYFVLMLYLLFKICIQSPQSDPVLLLANQYVWEKRAHSTVNGMAVAGYVGYYWVLDRYTGLVTLSLRESFIEFHPRSRPEGLLLKRSRQIDESHQ